MLRHALFLPSIAALGGFVYPLIALAIFLEGEAVIYTVMFLTFQGILDWRITVLLVCVSVIATDYISYQVGKYGPSIFPRVARIYGRITEPLDDQLHRVSLTVYMVSKFTYGFHRAVLIRSGMIGIPFRKLLKINLITNAVWIIVITLVAFASSKSIEHVGASLRYVERFLLLGVVGVLIGSHIVSHFTKKKLLGKASETL